MAETFTGSQEVEGRLYVGSDLVGSSVNVNVNPVNVPAASFDSLIVKGDILNANVNINNGGGLTGAGNLINSTINLNAGGGNPSGTATIGGTRMGGVFNQGTLIENATNLNIPEIDFAYLADQSAFLASLSGAAADVSNQNNKKFFAAPNADPSEALFGANTTIIETSLADLSSGGYSIDLTGIDTLLINVSGAAGTFAMNALGINKSSASRIIWNFSEATGTINVNTAIIGNVLAPSATLVGFSGSTEGTVIGKELQLTNGELHHWDFEGTVPLPSPVPLPAGLPLLAGSVAALALLRRRAAC